MKNVILNIKKSSSLVKTAILVISNVKIKFIKGKSSEGITVSQNISILLMRLQKCNHNKAEKGRMWK